MTKIIKLNNNEKIRVGYWIYLGIDIDYIKMLKVTKEIKKLLTPKIFGILPIIVGKTKKELMEKIVIEKI